MKDLMEPFAPDLPFEDLFGAGTGFESFLPGEPEPPRS
jgi:hypothetical protein